MTTENLPSEVFGEADSEWNQARQALEQQLLRAAAELIAHTSAAGLQVQGYGVDVHVAILDPQQ